MLGIVLSVTLIAIFWLCIKSMNETARSVFIVKWKYPIIFICSLISIIGILFSSYYYYLNNERMMIIQSERIALGKIYRKFMSEKKGATNALARFESAARPVADEILKKDLGRVVVSLVKIPDCCISVYQIKYQNRSDYYLDLGKLDLSDTISYTVNGYFSRSQESEDLKGSGLIAPTATALPEFSKIFSAGHISNVRTEIHSNIFVDRFGRAIDFSKIAAESRNDLSVLKKSATDAAVISDAARDNYRAACVKLAHVVSVKFSDIEKLRQTDDWKSVDSDSAADLDRCYTEFGKERA